MRGRKLSTPRVARRGKDSSSLEPQRKRGPDLGPLTGLQNCESKDLLF